MNNSVYAVMAGLEQAIEYINELHFTENDIVLNQTECWLCKEIKG